MRSASTALVTQGVSGLPLLSTRPNCSGVPVDRQLADDRGVVELGGGEVEPGRQVDDEPVDLAVLQRLHREVVGRVLRGRRAGLDDVGDRVEARGALLRAELGALEAGDAW